MGTTKMVPNIGAQDIVTSIIPHIVGKLLPGERLRTATFHTSTRKSTPISLVA